MVEGERFQVRDGRWKMDDALGVRIEKRCEGRGARGKKLTGDEPSQRCLCNKIVVLCYFDSYSRSHDSCGTLRRYSMNSAH